MTKKTEYHFLPHAGLEYEIRCAAYFALQLYKSEEIEGFQLRMNDAEFACFDDVVVDVQMKNGQKYYFAFQLNLRLSPRSFKAGRFDIGRYCKSFGNLTDDKKKSCNFILYTNTPTDEDFTMVYNSDYLKELDFFDVNSNSKNIYKCTNDSYEQFSSKFWIFTRQNFKDLESRIANILEDEGVILRFIDQFRKWHLRNFSGIDKKTVGFHLVDMYLSVLSPHIATLPPLRNDNDCLQLIERALRKFDVVFLDDSKTNFLEHPAEALQYLLYERINTQLKYYMNYYDIQNDDSEKALEECLLLLAKNYGLIQQQNDLNAVTKGKIEQYFFKKLLIIDCNDESENLIFKMIEFYQLKTNNLNFVLLGKEIDNKRLPHLTFFKNLNDLQDDKNYGVIIAKVKISLQGEEYSLDKFLNLHEELAELTGLKELLQMTQSPYLIGKKREYSSSFIPRTVTTTLLDLETVLDYLRNTKDLIIITCLNLQQIQNLAQQKQVEFATLADYFESSKPPLILTDKGYNPVIFNEICKANKNRNIHFFKKVEDGLLLLVSTEKQVLSKIKMRRYPLPQKKMLEFFNGPVNILCAKPCSGKSTMLKYLHSTSSPQYWTVLTSLKDKNFDWKKYTVDQIIDALLKINEENDSYTRKIKQMFASKKKVILFLDGLDELNSHHIDTALSLLKEVSHTGLQIWISSRKPLQDKMEDHLNTFSIEVDDLTATEQKMCLQKTKAEKYITEQITSYSDTFCNPLNLKVAIETIADETINRNAVLIETFRRLLEARFETFKKESGHLDFEDIREKYQVAACQTLFDDENFAKLNLDKRRNQRFLNGIKRSGDPLRIIFDISKENKAIFAHHSFTDFFAAELLANNSDKVVLLKEELFLERYDSLLRMLNLMLADETPLHLAIFCKDFDSIMKHLQDDQVKIYDKGKRNPLHIVNFIGMRQLNLKYSSSESSYVVEDERFAERTKEDTLVIKKIVKVLLQNFDPSEKDNLFDWNSWNYSLVYGSLYIFNEICEKYSSTEYFDLLKESYNVPTIIYYSCCYGYFKLLSLALATEEDNQSFIMMKDLNENSLLHLAAKRGDNTVVTYLLDKIDLNLQNAQGETALHCAVQQEHLDTVRHLVEKGANVKRSNKKKETALDYAVKKGNLEMVRFLVDIAHARNETLETPLLIALKEGHFEIVRFLIKEGADIQIRSQRREDATSKIQFLLDRDLNVNTPDAIIREPTALHYAARRDDISKIQFLLKRGVNVNTPDARGETALHNAVAFGYREVVRCLVENGASVNAVSMTGESVLHYAVTMNERAYHRRYLRNESRRSHHKKFALPGFEDLEDAVLEEMIWHYRDYQVEIKKLNMMDIIEYLIANSVRVNVENEDGETPLHYAVQEGHVDIARYLIEKGADFKKSNYWSNDSILHYAVKAGSPEMVTMLLDLGAQLDTENRFGLTPLHYAIQRSYCDITSYLIEQGARVQHYISENPLSCAARNGNLKIVELLMAKDAAVNGPNKYGETPLYHAVEGEYFDVVHYLIENGAHVFGTSLHCAAKKGSLKTVKFFMNRGAEVNAENDQGETPLFYAIRGRSLDMVKYLIEAGASVNTQNIKTLDTPLHEAVKNKDVNIVDLLISKDADLNARNKDGKTALDVAVERKYQELANRLCTRGPSSSTK